MTLPELTEEQRLQLEKQDTRLITEFKANKLELEAQKNWDLFYKRNETNFFKDRHWTKMSWTMVSSSNFNIPQL